MLITSNSYQKMIKKVVGVLVFLVFVMLLFNQRAYAIKKSLTLSEKKIVISKGEKNKLKATAIGLKNKVTWTSSNRRVATVKGGVIVGRGKGTTTITAKCGKYKAKCKVTVKTKTAIYHTERGNVRYSEYPLTSPCNLIIDIKENELIVEGKMGKEILGQYKKPAQEKGNRHIFILSSSTKFWNGDMEIDKKEFLYIAKNYRTMWANADTLGFLLDMKDGKVVNVGFI